MSSAPMKEGYIVRDKQKHILSRQLLWIGLTFSPEKFIEIV